MAQNARVPQFGNWESDGSVPYTQYFENARKGKNAAMLINPNDPLENPEAFYKDDPPVHASPSRRPSSQEPARVKHERRKSRDDTSDRQPANYRNTEASSTQKRSSGSYNQRYDDGNLGDHPRRPSQSNGGYEQSVERSPLHPQVRSASKDGVSSPSRERRISSEKHGLAPNTPGRTKLKPGDRSDYMLDKGLAVPKFGGWDVMDPTSADGYSIIFNQVREEKHSGSMKIPSISNESYSNVERRKGKSESIPGIVYQRCHPLPLPSSAPPPDPILHEPRRSIRVSRPLNWLLLKGVDAKLCRMNFRLFRTITLGSSFLVLLELSLLIANGFTPSSYVPMALLKDIKLVW